jgi:hypothetical protein
MESSSDRKQLYDVEAKSKILHDKNKMLYTEVLNMRKDYEQKDHELEKA